MCGSRYLVAVLPAVACLVCVLRWHVPWRCLLRCMPQALQLLPLVAAQRSIVLVRTNTVAPLRLLGVLAMPAVGSFRCR